MKNNNLFEIIAFDADDTLWHNEFMYLQGKNLLMRLLSDYQDPDITGAALDQSEAKNIQFFGYGFKSFTLSMVDTAAQICGENVPTNIVGEILTFSKQMLYAEPQLFEGVEDTLATLSPRYNLMVITKGDQHEQDRKIARSGLAPYFKYIEVVGEKSQETYQRILSKFNLSAHQFLMIGNSLKSDILPVLQIGGQAVFIPYDQTWDHEHVTEDDMGQLHYHEIHTITQIPDLLEKLNTGLEGRAT